MLFSGDEVIFGRYEQDGDMANGPEPVIWIVLGSVGDSYLLLSKYALDAVAYLPAKRSVTWPDSYAR